MTNNQRKAAFIKLLHHYILHTDEVYLCHFIADLNMKSVLTKGETVFLRAMVSAELNHLNRSYLHSVIERKKVKYWFFFERLETMRELRIRWLQEQIAKFNV